MPTNRLCPSIPPTIMTDITKRAGTLANLPSAARWFFTQVGCGRLLGGNGSGQRQLPPG